MTIVGNSYDMSLKVSAKGNSKEKLPAISAVATTTRQTTYTLPIQPPPPPNGFNNRSLILFDIEPHDVPEASHMIFRLKLSASGANCKLLPAYEFFDDITIQADKGVGQELHRYYPINCLLWDYVTKNEFERDFFKHDANYNIEHLSAEGKEKYFHSQDSELLDGESRYYYIPLPYNYFHMGAFDGRLLNSPLRLKLQLSNDILTNDSVGTVANISLDAIDLMVLSHHQQDFDKNYTMSKKMASNHSYIHLDTDQLIYNDKNLQNNAETVYALDTFVGKAAALVVVIKNTTAPSGDDKINYNNVGDHTTFDLTNSSGMSLYSNGNPTTVEFLDRLMSMELGGKPLHGVYILPFCNDLKSAYAGRVNGYHELNGQRDFLRINFGNSPVAEVHTLTLSTTPTAGNFHIGYSGEYTDIISYTAPDTTVQNRINDLNIVKNKGYTCTVTGTPASGNMVITWNPKNGSVSKNIGLPTCSFGSLFDGGNWSVVLTTKGVGGFVGSSNYTTDIYMLKYSKTTFTRKGKIEQRDL